MLECPFKYTLKRTFSKKFSTVVEQFYCFIVIFSGYLNVMQPHTMNHYYINLFVQHPTFLSDLSWIITSYSPSKPLITQTHSQRDSFHCEIQSGSPFPTRLESPSLKQALTSIFLIFLSFLNSFSLIPSLF